MPHVLKPLRMLLALVALTFCAARHADAGPIFLSGDFNIINPLTGSIGAPVDPGNRQFFRNVLDGGSRVVVQGTRFSDDVNTFYNGLGGVSSSIFVGSVTGAALAGADLFISIAPDAAYTAGEISALNNFLAGGGTVFFLGDNFLGFPAQDANINLALAGLGSGLSILPEAFDDDFRTATGSQIAGDPFTAGVNTLTYAAPSRVSGGQALFFGTEGQAFVTYQSDVPIPEPATMLLLGTGLAGIGGMIRRRRG